MKSIITEKIPFFFCGETECKLNASYSSYSHCILMSLQMEKEQFLHLEFVMLLNLKLFFC